MEHIFTWSPPSIKRTVNYSQPPPKTESDEKIVGLQSIWLRSCIREESVPLMGRIVHGTVPKWLNGVLVRNGPGSLYAGRDRFDHWFDGSALLHKYRIENGRVTYESHFIRTDVYRRNYLAGRCVQNEFGTTANYPDPCRTIFQRIYARFFTLNMSDNSTISVYPMGRRHDEIYAYGETTYLHKIRIEPHLRTVGRVDVSRYVRIMSQTSHPHYDHVTGDVYNVATSIRPLSGPYYSVVHYKNGENLEQTEIVASIPARWRFHPSYMHSFGMTANYFVVIEQPMTVALTGVIGMKFRDEPIVSCLRWYQNQPTQITVIHRNSKSGKTLRFSSDTFFFFHIVNQYEVDDQYLVLDVIIYRDGALIDCLYVDNLKNFDKNPDFFKLLRSRPVRFVLPLNVNLDTDDNLVKLDGSSAQAYFPHPTTHCRDSVYVVPEKLCDSSCEVPTINYPYYSGKPYRYFYATGTETLLKVDTKLKRVETWTDKTPCLPSEPIFVGRPNPKAEDDGLILSSLLWPDRDNLVTLVVLNAEDMREICRVEFSATGPVPKCLHGWFLSETTHKNSRKNI